MTDERQPSREFVGVRWTARVPSPAYLDPASSGDPAAWPLVVGNEVTLSATTSAPVPVRYPPKLAYELPRVLVPDDQPVDLIAFFEDGCR